MAMDDATLAPWYVDDRIIGWTEVALIPRLVASGTFMQAHTKLRLAPSLHGYEARSEALQRLAVALRDEGLMPGWRNERHDLLDENGTVRFSIERAAFRTFGLQARAVHVNGSTASGKLWIARRAANKATDPGMLDNLAAGLVASGESPDDCMVRELGEEAGVPPDLAQHARFTGHIHSQRRVPGGLHDELLHCYDLQLPDDFAPVNADGEVSEFMLVDCDLGIPWLSAMTADEAMVTTAWLAKNPG